MTAEVGKPQGRRERVDNKATKFRSLGSSSSLSSMTGNALQHSVDGELDKCINGRLACCSCTFPGRVTFKGAPGERLFLLMSGGVGVIFKKGFE